MVLYADVTNWSIDEIETICKTILDDGNVEVDDKTECINRETLQFVTYCIAPQDVCILKK
mgnify:CR=1 FL=1